MSHDQSNAIEKIYLKSRCADGGYCCIEYENGQITVVLGRRCRKIGIPGTAKNEWAMINAVKEWDHEGDITSALEEELLTVLRRFRCYDRDEIAEIPDYDS
jgi:hypothetical protein